MPADVAGFSTTRRRRQPAPKGIGLVAKCRDGVDRILWQPGPENSLLQDAAICTAVGGGSEYEVEVIGHRVTKGVIGGVGNAIGAFDVPNSPEIECTPVRNHRAICPTVAVECLDVVVGVVVGGRARPEHTRVVLGHPVAEAIGKPLCPIPVGVDGTEHSATAFPDAVVTTLDANVGLEQVDRPPAVGENIDFHLEIENVVPLREVEIVVEAFIEDADLHLAEAVGLNASVEELEGRGAGRDQAQGDRRGQSQQPSHLEHRGCLQRRHLRIGTHGLWRTPPNARVETRLHG